MPINTLPRDPITPEEQTSRPVLEVRRIDLVPETGDPIRLPIEAPTNVVSFKAGSVVEFEIHITDAEGNDLPIDGEFALPLAGQMGTSPRIVDVVFVSGVAVLTLGEWTSGRWRVTEEEVNIDLAPDETKFSFDGLTIKVRE